PPEHVVLEVVPEHGPRLRPALADVVQILGPDLGELEAGADGPRGEARVLLDPAEPLLADGEQPLAPPADAARGIVALGVGDADRDHVRPYAVGVVAGQRGQPARGMRSA